VFPQEGYLSAANTSKTNLARNASRDETIRAGKKPCSECNRRETLPKIYSLTPGRCILPMLARLHADLPLAFSGSSFPYFEGCFPQSSRGLTAEFPQSSRRSCVGALFVWNTIGPC